MNKKAEARTACARCGTCCGKGGPAFHACDRPILESGRISLADIYTIRTGEPVFDNVAGRLDTAPEDIIKIRSVDGGTACLFYRPDGHACSVYENRPMECR
ncbi:MAG: YkgJ family cysteine cluster protein, partial [Thermodesulfobacteriota bacterium]